MVIDERRWKNNVVGTKRMKLIKSELTIYACSANSVSASSGLWCVRLAGSSSSDERSVSIFRYSRESHVAEVIHFIFLLILLPVASFSLRSPHLLLIFNQLFLTSCTSILCTLHRVFFLAIVLLVTHVPIVLFPTCSIPSAIFR